MVAICTPYDGQPQHQGNGNMLALPVKRADIERVYNKALELGATDEGAPGERLPVFYGAYVRDPDGNKICFYEMTM
jgi:catechol 2,3-dioxygenase-like lactoylglutathione lyase family enzyme